MREKDLKRLEKTYQRKENKKVQCIDCGKEFELNPKSRMKEIRCTDCYEAHRKKIIKEKVYQKREQQKV